MCFTNHVGFSDGNALNRVRVHLLEVVAATPVLLLFLALCLFASVIPAKAQVAPTPPFRQCPAAGLDTSCRILIVYNPDGSRRIYTDPNVSPTYDGADDTLIGVLNNSPNPISAVPLNSNGTGPIFGFDGDGICSASIKPNPAGCPFGPTEYEGPGVTFGSINSDQSIGVVNFNPAIPAGGAGYFGLEVAIPTVCADADGDGLCDTWETNGLTVVVNGLPVFVNLPAMGANPRHKDIFIQADYMVDPGVCFLGICAFGHTHQPQLAAVAMVTQAFANAPVANPDGTTGIRLHVDCGPACIMNPVTSQTWGALSQAKSLAHQTTLGVAPGGNYDWTAFDIVKKANFNQARQQAFHYVVFGHNLGDLDGTSGISRGITASDFIVSLGSWPNQIGTTMQQAGTLMHELGHNLSFLHGGVDSVNYKPNFLSVMNYHFQMGGLIVNGAQGTLDYSRFLLPSLNENSLNEPVGLNGGAPIATYGTMYFCVGAGATTFVATANNAIDWNCDGNNQQNNVATDINKDGARTVLGTYNDWANIVFNGGSVGELGLSSALPTVITAQNEVTPAIDATITKPLGVMVSSPGVLQLPAGGSADLIFTITNTGTTDDSYNLTSSASQPWGSLAVVPASVTLASGQSTQITIHATVPAGTAPGAVGDFAIKAISMTSSAIQDNGLSSLTVVGNGSPRLSGSIGTKSTTGTTMTLNLQLTNLGPGPAANVTITAITAKTISGSGTVTLTAPVLPYTVGNLGVGGSATVSVVLDIPATVSRFSLTQSGSVQDAGSNSYSYATSEIVQK